MVYPDITLGDAQRLRVVPNTLIIGKNDNETKDPSSTFSHVSSGTSRQKNSGSTKRENRYEQVITTICT